MSAVALADEMRVGLRPFSPFRLWQQAQREGRNEAERSYVYRHAAHHARMFKNWRGPNSRCPLCGARIELPETSSRGRNV